jgi:hypothetical protein
MMLKGYLQLRYHNDLTIVTDGDGFTTAKPADEVMDWKNSDTTTIATSDDSLSPVDVDATHGIYNGEDDNGVLEPVTYNLSKQ